MSAEQQSLFKHEPDPWREDDDRQQFVAQVVFPSGPKVILDYLVPPQLAEHNLAGARVRVPMGRGNRRMLGYCVAAGYRRDHRGNLKPIGEVIDDEPLLTPQMLRLTQWISEHYLCPWGQVLDAVIPAAVRASAGTRMVTHYFPSAQAQVGQPGKDLPKKQAAALHYLLQATDAVPASEITQAVGCTLAPVTALRKRGLVEIERRRLRTSIEQPTTARLQSSGPTLNAEQQAAVDAVTQALDERRQETFLLRGVTGSGKTEVYLHTIEHVIRFGHQAIVLVPEISLTPQTTQRFAARFGEVAVLHSHLTDVERARHWEAIASGDINVVVGARSAIFAPTPHLGLIVIDEEHEPSFKQSTAPRYHARTVALQRAREERIPLILGTATPSLETWRAAKGGDCKLIELHGRVLDRPMPPVGTIDLRNEDLRRDSRGAISRPLHAAMDQALKAGGQVMLLLNRRGYSTHIQCPACGFVAVCPHCEIALTHHRLERIALCHLCDYQIPAPGQCPECSFEGIRYSGRGTQRLEAEVAARFPEARVLRMDTDAMTRPGSHERAFEAFRRREIDVMVGTQMIAKGLDFPDVTLVGVVNADTALHLPDFRAAERTFQLLVQVAGRTGRSDRGGRVLVQTKSPDHPAIAKARRHDFAGFAEIELDVRKQLSYPPFGSMIRIVVRGPKEQLIQASAERIGEMVCANLLAAEQAEAENSADAVSAARKLRPSRVLGPAPAPYRKLRGDYRFQLQVQGTNGERLRNAVRQVQESLELPEGVQWMADVDPYDML
ncbi:MAG: primosomal protein N' [Pirellulales bacterium]|nr:primosomal protein N' [Pirellulales bacterium]